MKEYTIVKCSATPDWDKIPALDIDLLFWTEATDVRAQARIGYSEDALHVRLQAWEKDIRAVEEGRLGSPCEDSCLEFGRFVASGLCCLEFFAVGNTASDFFDDFTQSSTHRNFNKTYICDFTAESKYLCTLGGFSTY